MPSPNPSRRPSGVRSRSGSARGVTRSGKGRAKTARRAPRRPMRSAAALVVLLVVGTLGYQAARADLVGPTSGSAWPLTGVPTAAAAVRPALAVKIENSLDARPQTGLG